MNRRRRQNRAKGRAAHQGSAAGAKEGVVAGEGGRTRFTAVARRRAPLLRFAALLGAGGALALLLLTGRPQPAWIVTPEFSGLWREVVARADDAPAWPIIEENGEATEARIPRGRYGLVVTAQLNAVSDGSYPVIVHHHLARGTESDGAFPVALDPWLVVRRHTTAQLPYAAVDSGIQPASSRRSGAILLPGSDESAVRAWTAQLLQEAPGVFSPDIERWRDTSNRLAGSGRFQSGALTYDWEDIWPRLFGPEAAWVYAPLSRVQQLPGDRTSVLEADRFPIPDHWNEYGLQARVLWAAPFGPSHGLFGGQRERRMAEARQWLLRETTQSLIAGYLKWVPAHRNARSVNPLAAAAHRAWIGSSYVWEEITRETIQ